MMEGACASCRFSGSGVQITGCSACHQSAFMSDVLFDDPSSFEGDSDSAL
jgi:hypothetical protein